MSIVLSLTSTQQALLTQILHVADVPDNQEDLDAILAKLAKEPKVKLGQIEEVQGY